MPSPSICKPPPTLTPPKLKSVAVGNTYGVATLIVPSPATAMLAPALTPPNADDVAAGSI